MRGLVAQKLLNLFSGLFCKEMFLKSPSYGFRTTGFFKSYFIIGVIALSTVFFLYSYWVTKRWERETSEFSKMLANFAAKLPSITDKETSDEAKVIIDKLRIPFIITNAKGEPIIARGIGNGLREKLLAKTLTDEDKEKLANLIKEMNKNYQPIPMKGVLADEGRKIIGYIYYGETRYALNQVSAIVVTDIAEEPIFWYNIPNTTEDIQSFIEKAKSKGYVNTIQFNPPSEEAYFHFGRTYMIHVLRLWMPLMQMTMVAVFLIIGFVGYQKMKHNEQQAIWAGLAKETAHQLGTPISSLMGWLEILRDNHQTRDVSEIPDAEYIYKEMQGDIQRLNDITARFGEIGSVPKREPLDISETIHRGVEYFQKRLPYRQKHVEIIESHQNIPLVEANENLLQWVIENLIRNSLDAINRDDGKINIRTEFDPKKREVLIIYSDNGKGIPRKNRVKVFIPGYTSKKHGWGLGLPIVKRIIEGYHNGKVKISESSSQGTTFVISLPEYRERQVS